MTTRPVMRMQWLHLLFIHYRVDASVLRPLIPACFDIDTFDGSGYVGLVPFTMRDVSPRLLPRIPLRGVTDFHECNVRTYVRSRGEPAVYFFSLDAQSRLGVWGARTFFHLPYFNARISLQRRDDEVRYTVDRTDHPRAAMRCRWRAGAPLAPSAPGSLSHFLTERYALVTTDRQGRPCIGHIEHVPWPLREASLLELDDGLLPAAGISPAGPPEPLLLHADRIDVRAHRLRRL